MSAQHNVRVDVAETAPWRNRAEEWMHPETLARRDEVTDGAERIGDDQNAALRPPQRDLLPRPAFAHDEELERRAVEQRHGQDVMLHTEQIREEAAIATMTIQQLNDGRRFAGVADAILDTASINGIDQPHASVDDERV